jgi:hypothetical protein
MDLAKALNLDETVTFDDEYNGEKFSFTAKKNVLTPDLLQKFQDVNKRPEAQAEMLAGILTGWTIDMHGELYPPTFENLNRIPTDFLWQIFNRIAETWSGNDADKKKSASGSAASGK